MSPLDSIFWLNGWLAGPLFPGPWSWTSSSLSSLCRRGWSMCSGFWPLNSFWNCWNMVGALPLSVVFRAFFLVLILRKISPALACLWHLNQLILQGHSQFLTLCVVLHPLHLAFPSSSLILKATLSAFVGCPHSLQRSALSLLLRPLAASKNHLSSFLLVSSN